MHSAGWPGGGRERSRLRRVTTGAAVAGAFSPDPQAGTWHGWCRPGSRPGRSRTSGRLLCLVNPVSPRPSSPRSLAGVWKGPAPVSRSRRPARNRGSGATGMPPEAEDDPPSFSVGARNVPRVLSDLWCTVRETRERRPSQGRRDAGGRQKQPADHNDRTGRP